MCHDPRSRPRRQLPGPHFRTGEGVRIKGRDGVVRGAWGNAFVEALTAAGAIMGSGGFVVMDESTCMVDMARYFLEFPQDQSCGKCTYCRIGTRRMLEILERICAGNFTAGGPLLLR